MSSVADYMQPGVSAIWLGVGNARMHISFEQVKQLRAALGCWIDNGTFDDDGNRCESCGGDLGDDAPQCDDANICRKCHEELKRAERQMRPIMWAELKVDCYSGPECNQHRRYWDGFGDGDKEGGEIGEVIELAASTFPAGAKVVVSIPVCPDCHEDAEMCQCGFDWEKWAEERYA